MPAAAISSSSRRPAGVMPAPRSSVAPSAKSLARFQVRPIERTPSRPNRRTSSGSRPSGSAPSSVRMPGDRAGVERGVELARVGDDRERAVRLLGVAVGGIDQAQRVTEREVGGVLRRAVDGQQLHAHAGGGERRLVEAPEHVALAGDAAVGDVDQQVGVQVDDHRRSPRRAARPPITRSTRKVKIRIATSVVKTTSRIEPIAISTCANATTHDT